MLAGMSISSSAQSGNVVAVLSVDCPSCAKGNEHLTSMLRTEVSRMGDVTVLDPYEIEEVMKQHNINVDNCFSKNCVLSAGKLLGVDQVLSGTVEVYSGKTVITLRLFSVVQGSMIETDVTEYVNDLNEMQRMLRISAHHIYHRDPDKVLAEQLVNIEPPVTSRQTLLNLNGPRFGLSFFTGETGSILTSSESNGGFNMFPATFVLGYQQEFRYQTSGNFQALVEVIPSISGMESGYIIPSLTLLNGFRWGRGGWEIGFGPTLRLVKQTRGFIDQDGILGTPGAWITEKDWQATFDDTTGIIPPPYPVYQRPDSRGELELSAGLLVGFGRTFRIGHLNIPVNLYFSPRKNGSMYGLSCGFNIARK